MSSRRLLTLKNVPHRIKLAFWRAPTPKTNVDRLWREVAARAVLDALGHTGIGQATRHNRLVMWTRLWFRHTDKFILSQEQTGDDELLKDTHGVEDVFEFADIDLPPVREEVLNMKDAYKD